MKKEIYYPKEKLTITIDKKVKEEAKRAAEEKHIPLSGLIQNFLEFFTNSWVYCFKCGEKFNVKDAEICPKCGWLKCPNCGACGCGLDEKTATAVYNMRKVYEDLLAGRVKK